MSAHRNAALPSAPGMISPRWERRLRAWLGAAAAAVLVLLALTLLSIVLHVLSGCQAHVSPCRNPPPRVPSGELCHPDVACPPCPAGCVHGWLPATPCECLDADSGGLCGGA